MLRKIIIVLPFYRQAEDYIWVTQLKLQYNTAVAMQDNAAQHWWYRQFQILVKHLRKWYVQAFDEDGGRNLHRYDLRIDSCR